MANILLAVGVDEYRRTVRELLSDRAEWRCLEARTQEEALSFLEEEEGEASRVDILLTDAGFGEGGVEGFLGRVRARRPFLPVVLMTARGADETVVRALRLGAASYVPRSALARDLASTVARVLSLCRKAEPPASILGRRIESSATFELENDARLFPPLVALLQDELERFGLVRGDERVFAGVAIEEALVNGMVHGNLEIEAFHRNEGFRAFEERVEKRRRTRPYSERCLTVTARLTSMEGSVTVRDEGRGFDASSVPDPLASENLSRSSGRGLLLMRTFMDEVVFNEKGNEVRLVKRRKETDEPSPLEQK